MAVAGREWGLDLDAETVELRRLRVVADANSNTPPQEAAGVRIRASKQVTIQDCEFLQGDWLEPAAFSSVAIQSPRASLEPCCFLGGKRVNRPGAPAMGGGGWLEKVNEGGLTAVASWEHRMSERMRLRSGRMPRYSASRGNGRMAG